MVDEGGTWCGADGDGDDGTSFTGLTKSADSGYYQKH